MNYRKNLLLLVLILLAYPSLYSMKRIHSKAFNTTQKPPDVNHYSTILIEAIKTCNVQIVRHCLTVPMTVISRDIQGTTPLMVAAEIGDEIIVRAIIGSLNSLKSSLLTQASNSQEPFYKKFIDEISLDVENNLGNTALIIACIKGHAQVAQELIAYGARIEPKNKLGNNALFYASKCNNSIGEQLMSVFIKNITSQTKEDINQALLLAVPFAVKSDIRTLINYSTDINTTDKEGNTALLLAISNSRKNIVKLLISLGADVNLENKKCKTPLITAIENKSSFSIINKSFSIIQLLIQSGARVNASKSTLKSTAPVALQEVEVLRQAFRRVLSKKSNQEMLHQCLRIASFFGYPTLIKELVEKGGNITDDLLTIAINQQHLPMIQFLIHHGTTFVLKSQLTENSLDYAIENNKFAAAHKLIELGAPLTHKTEYGQCTLEGAIIKGNTDLVKLILSQDKPNTVEHTINRQFAYKRTPLHFAALYGHKNLVAELIKAGADTERQDKGGEKPLEYALTHVKDGTKLLPFSTDIKDTAKLLIEAQMTKDPYAQIPLHFAAAANCKDIIEHYLKNTKVNNYSKNNALRTAIEEGNVTIVETLCKYGADINKKDAQEQTFLDIALDTENIQTVITLLKYRAISSSSYHNFDKENIRQIVNLSTNIFIKNFLEDPKAYFESALSHLKVTKQYSRECNPYSHRLNTCTHFTLLMIVSMFGTCEQIKTLLTYDASEEERAAFFNNTMTSQEKEDFLKKYLVSENYLGAQDNDGCTALHYAILCENYPVATLLIQIARSSIHIKNKDNKTPLDYIASKLLRILNPHIPKEDEPKVMEEKIRVLIPLLHALIHKGARFTGFFINTLFTITHSQKKKLYRPFLDEFIINMALRYRWRNDPNVSHNTEFLPDRDVTLLN